MGSEIDDTDTTKFNPLLNIQKMESTIDKKKLHYETLVGNQTS